jgi:hypothetical protein
MSNTNITEWLVVSHFEKGCQVELVETGHFYCKPPSTPFDMLKVTKADNLLLLQFFKIRHYRMDYTSFRKNPALSF